jgi:nickel/cobalt transporter (NicO) family protein
MFHAPLQLFLSVIAISILHAILPNHWLPVVAISRQMNWTARRTAIVTMLAALAHSSSTVIIGILLAIGGMKLGEALPFFRFVAAGILVLLGLYFIWKHQHHKHFHMKDVVITSNRTMGYILGSILLAMFLSPCLEVGALFLVAGSEGISTTLAMAAIYTVTSATGMTLFAWLALQGLRKMDWHKLEHRSGLISGMILVLTGLLFLVLR